MTFDEVLGQAIDMLQRRGRVTYRALKRQFQLDDEFLEDIKEQLIEAQELAIDKDGKMLVWIGDRTPASVPTDTLQPSKSPPPRRLHPSPSRRAHPS